MNRLLLLVAAWVNLLLSACSNPDVMSVKELDSLINEHLSPGDSSEKIEEFLKEQDWPVRYDRFRKRYSSEYSPARKKYATGMKETVGVDIYVNDDMTFKEAVVEKVYTYF